MPITKLVVSAPPEYYIGGIWALLLAQIRCHINPRTNHEIFLRTLTQLFCGLLVKTENQYRVKTAHNFLHGVDQYLGTDGEDYSIMDVFYDLALVKSTFDNDVSQDITDLCCKIENRLNLLRADV